MKHIVTATWILASTIAAAGPEHVRGGPWDADGPVFVENRGQFDAAARFVARQGALTLFLREDGLAFSVADARRRGSSRPIDAAFDAPSRAVGLFCDFEGTTRSPAVRPRGRVEKRFHFMRGDRAGWRTDVSAFQSVVYRDVAPGVDVELHARGGRLAFDLHLAPSARPDELVLRWRGAEGISVAPSGDLVVRTAIGALHVGRPAAVERSPGGARDEVPARFDVIDDERCVLRLDGGSAHAAATIDPTFSFSTYLGGGQTDIALGVALDQLCVGTCSYACGRTLSPSYPTTAGAYDTSHNGNFDAFVTRVSPPGTALSWSTFIGGGDLDAALDVDVNANNDVAVVGATFSTDFPTSAGAYDTTHNTSNDAFALKLSGFGSTLAYSTYLGGAVPAPLIGYDFATGVAVDPSGRFYVTGQAGSVLFSGSPGGYDTSYNLGFSDAFLVLLDPSASGAASLVSWTYLGGTQEDGALAVVLDDLVRPYVTICTNSTDVRTTPGAPQPTAPGGTEDVIVARFASDLSTLEFSTYLGGSASDHPTGLAVEGSRNVFVTGETTSPAFPGPTGSPPLTPNGTSDAFVTKIHVPTGTLTYSTLLGGSGRDVALGIDVDAAGNAYLTGFTNSPDFPVTLTAFQPTPSGPGDAFLTWLNPAGTALSWSSYFGGQGTEQGWAIEFDGVRGVFFAGETDSTDLPALGFDVTPNGGTDAFSTRFSFP